MISIIILNYNGRKNLGAILTDCLSSVLNSDYPNFEVLFVDNASIDDSVSFVKMKFGSDARLRIIKNEQNLGFAEGNNTGIRAAKGDYFALVNSDTTVSPSWLKGAEEAILPPGVGAVQSKLLDMHSPHVLDSAGGLLDYYGYHLERGRGEKASAYNKSVEIFYAKGAAVLIKRDILAKIGLFDSDIFLYFDEVDLCWRIWLYGHSVVYVPNSIVCHASGKTASNLQQRQRMYFYVRNHILVLMKNYDLENALKSMVVSLLFEARNIVVFLLKGKPLLALSIIEAISWNLAHLKATWRKRRFVQSQIRKVSDGEIKRHMLKPSPTFPLYILFPRARYTSTRYDT